MNIYWLNRYLHFFRRFIKYWKEIDEVKEILFEITLKIEMSEIMSETYRIKWKNWIDMKSYLGINDISILYILFEVSY